MTDEQKIAIPASDVHDLDDVVRELGIEDSDTTPAEAVRELKAEIERLRGALQGAEDEIETLRNKARAASAAIAWMENEDPLLVASAEDKFGPLSTGTAGKGTE